MREIRNSKEILRLIAKNVRTAYRLAEYIYNKIGVLTGFDSGNLQPAHFVDRVGEIYNFREFWVSLANLKYHGQFFDRFESSSHTMR